VPVFLRYEEGFYETLSLSIIRTYLGNAEVKIKLDELPFGGGSTIPSVRVGDLEIPLDESISALVPYPRRDRRLPLCLGDRRHPGHPAPRGAEGPHRHRGHFGPGPPGPARDAGPRGLSRRRGAREPRERLPRPVDHGAPGRGGYIAVITVLLVGLPFALILPRLSALTATDRRVGAHRRRWWR
jgi:hypothetical protein